MSEFRVGAARTNVTPPVGGNMAGYGARTHGSVGIHDELWSKALYLTDGTTEAVIITNDLIGFRAPAVERIRALVAEQAGLPGENVMISCSHTHGGPVTAYTPEPDPDDDRDVDEAQKAYMEVVFHKLAGAAFEAKQNAASAAFAHARTDVRVGINRRERAPDGSTKIGHNHDGPIAPYVDVMRFDAVETGRPLAVLCHHAAHGTTMGGDNYLLTADYPGRAQAFVEAQFPGVTALFCNGCAGNINPYPRGTFDLMERHGRRLGAAVVKALLDIYDLSTDVRLASASHAFSLPLQDLPGLDECRRAFEEAKADRDGIEEGAHMPWEVRTRYRTAKDRLKAAESGAPDSGLPVESQAIALNDLALVSLPGEIFVEIGMAIAQRSPFDCTLSAGYANGSVGYIPTSAEVPFGGYEVERARARHQGRFVADQADEALTEGALAALAKAADAVKA